LKVIAVKNIGRVTRMYINYGLNNTKKGWVTAWHEDATQAGNYVLTLQTLTGTLIHAIEKKLNEKQKEELMRMVPKDNTGL